MTSGNHVLQQAWFPEVILLVLLPQRGKIVVNQLLTAYLIAKITCNRGPLSTGIHPALTQAILGSDLSIWRGFPMPNAYHHEHQVAQRARTRLPGLFDRVI